LPVTDQRQGLLKVITLERVFKNKLLQHPCREGLDAPVAGRQKERA
jgi:hypothetical protein